jgi:hypothetical protein
VKGVDGILPSEAPRTKRGMFIAANSFSWV